MKMKSFIKQCSSRAASANALITGVALLSPCALLAEEPEAADDEAAASWVELSVGGADVKGNSAAFQHRHGSNGDFFGGSSSFRYEKMTDDGIFLLDGHALFGLDDYKINLSYVKDDFGFVRFGYTQYKKWYDGSGGYAGASVAPPNDWISLYDDELSLERGELFFQAGLRMPDVPELTLTYRHLWREGMKDSTVRGRPFNRGIAPSFYDLDETQDIISLDFLYTLGNTDIGAGLSYQNIKFDNTRNMFADTTTNTTAQNETGESDIFNAHLSSVTRINDKMLLSFGYSFTDLDADFGGSRVSSGGASTRHDYSQLMGVSDAKLQVANANFFWNVTDDLVIVPSLRFERRDQTVSTGEFIYEGEPHDQSGRDEFTKLTEQLEIRYSGIDNMLLYARAEIAQSEGDAKLVRDIEHGTDVSGRSTATDSDFQKYTVGANWYPCKGLSFATQYYNRTYDQDFDHVLTGNGLDAQLLQHNTDTHDFNFRVTWRAASNLTFVTRYDYQQIDIENQAAIGTELVDVADITRHIFSESVTWSPTSWMYLQGSFHYIESETATQSDNQVGAQVVDWNNDYWMASINAGFQLDKKTMLTVGYSYYEVDNYVDNSAVGTPYGSMAKDHALTVRLTRQLNDNMTWSMNYGYFKSDDEAYAGYNDYEAHVLSTGFRMSF
ncbi:MAG: hypothetical protein H7A51_08765 [Akkermansiaceae bacterium]|nr:hypothetical protein [Akkermansiaceae bacterium]